MNAVNQNYGLIHKYKLSVCETLYVITLKMFPALCVYIYHTNGYISYTWLLTHCVLYIYISVVDNLTLCILFPFRDLLLLCSEYKGVNTISALFFSFLMTVCFPAWR
jgi:hypothetical protein